MFRFSLVLISGTCFINSGSEATFSHFSSPSAFRLPSAASRRAATAFRAAARSFVEANSPSPDRHGGGQLAGGLITAPASALYLFS